LPSWAWLILSASLRSRIRAPMYLSMVLAFFGANFFSFALFTVLFTSDDLEIAITLNGDVARLVGMNRKFSLGHKDPVFAWTSLKKPPS